MGLISCFQVREREINTVLFNAKPKLTLIPIPVKSFGKVHNGRSKPQQSQWPLQYGQRLAAKLSCDKTKGT